jgi:hypothetical protein
MMEAENLKKAQALSYQERNVYVSVQSLVKHAW